MTKAEKDRDIARKETNTAREEAANLRGQVEAMQIQTTELMHALSDRHGKAEAEKQTNGKRS